MSELSSDKSHSLPAEATHEMLMAAKRLRSFYSLDDYAAIWRVMVKAFTPSHAPQNNVLAPGERKPGEIAGPLNDSRESARVQSTAIGQRDRASQERVSNPVEDTPYAPSTTPRNGCDVCDAEPGRCMTTTICQQVREARRTTASATPRSEIIEECAKVCDELRAQWDTPLGTSTWKHAFEEAAKKIRALRAADGAAKP